MDTMTLVRSKNYTPHQRFVALHNNDIEENPDTYVNFPHRPGIAASVRCRDVMVHQCLRRFGYFTF